MNHQNLCHDGLLEEASNIQLKSLVASLLLRTWQPVTKFAYANSLPERPRGLTGCYTPSREGDYQ